MARKKRRGARVGLVEVLLILAVVLMIAGAYLGNAQLSSIGNTVFWGVIWVIIGLLALVFGIVIIAILVDR